MARIRTIKPDFFTSADITALSPLARLLYIGTWMEADREGRLRWNLETLKLRYLPADTCDIEALATELTEPGLVVPYGDGFAFIPSFKEHQYINNKEAPSKLPEPTQELIDAYKTRAGRVKDAPSFPFLNTSFPSLSQRPAVQGRGAFEPGSLPRDHKGHEICGPAMRICLFPWQYKILEKAYNDPDVTRSRVVIVQFVEVLEQGTSSDHSIGKFSDIEKEFHNYLKALGRVPAKIDPKPKPRGVAELLAEEETRKAQQRSAL